MTKPGRRPTPTPLHLLRGASHHRQPSHEPAALPGPVDPPEHLGSVEREVWLELAPELAARKLLAPGYLHTFEILVYSITAWRKARDLLEVTGPLTRGRGDVLVSSPAAREFARFATLVLRYGAEFGLTPSSVTDMARREDELPDRADPARFLS